MKKIVLSILIACLAFSSSFAQDTKGPKIEFTKDAHDYGTIENGADGTCVFTFKNTGTEPLIISNCSASCGCTVPTWSKDAIAPKKTGTITVKYDTKRTGPINKSVTIMSNAVNSPTKVVTIKGLVNAPTESEGATKIKALIEEQKTVVEVPPTPPTPTGKAIRPMPPVKEANAKVNQAAERAVKEATEVVKPRKWYQFWKKKA